MNNKDNTELWAIWEHHPFNPRACRDVAQAKVVPLIYDETLTNEQCLRASEINTRTDGGPTIDSAKWVDDSDHSQGLLVWLTNGRGYRLDSDGSMWALQSYS